MGKIFLISNHHDFEELNVRTEFTKEMSEWKVLNSKQMIVYRNAISSFQELDNRFTLILCLEVDKELELFSYAHRGWGKLFFNETLIKTFSHDSSHDNNPFTSITEWPEIENYEVVDWTKDEWLSFWINCIKSTCNIYIDKLDKNIIELNVSVSKASKDLDRYVLVVNEINEALNI